MNSNYHSIIWLLYARVLSLFSGRCTFYISHTFPTHCYELFPKSHHQPPYYRVVLIIFAEPLIAGEKDFHEFRFFSVEDEISARAPGARVKFSESVLFQCNFKTIAELF